MWVYRCLLLSSIILCCSAFTRNGVTACNGGDILTQSPGNVTSPMYPGHYDNNLNCEWILQADTFQVVYIEWKSFSIEMGDNCQYDKVEVFDSTSLVGRFCGTQLPDRFMSTTNNVKVMFHTDFSGTAAGWLFTYAFYDMAPIMTTPPPDPNAWLGCYGMPYKLTSSTGSITSPWYPQSYHHNANCSWIIQASFGKSVEVSFASLDIEYQLSCNYDWLSIHDGGDRNAPMLRRICGTIIPPPITSSSTDMFLNFVSDQSISRDGFILNWRFVDRVAPTEDPYYCAPEAFPCLTEGCIRQDLYCNGESNCEDGSDEDWCVVNKECGVQDILPDLLSGSPKNRIVGGEGVKANSWPWMVDIRRDTQTRLCGGVLIHRQYVLTSARCLEFHNNPTSILFILGKHYQYLVGATEQTISGQIFYLHELYNSFTRNNDIALVKLATPATINRYVKPICLPRQDQQLFEGMTSYVVGWGQTEGTGTDAVLKQAQVNVITRQTCNQAEFYSGAVTASQFCAGSEDGTNGPCYGDEGGPLMQHYGGNWHLGGIVSRGTTCNQYDKPFIYTKVSLFIDWIESKLENEGDI